MSDSTRNNPSLESVANDGAATGTQSNNPGNGDTNTSDNAEATSSDEKGMTVDDLVYGVASFDAIVKPVVITMVVAALSTIYISTPESRKAGQEALANSYTVIQTSEDASDGTKLGQSLINGLVMVTVICTMTFVIVLLYKYRCIKCLVGYMMFAMTTLLGFVSARMFDIAIERYELRIDRVSYALTIFNFAMVGTVALFWGRGIPNYVGQGYLIAVSVIVAWQLSHFDAWTAWVLLVLLALYDLFAVLTPWGPLNALVSLMNKKDAPNLPGLLYEANLNMNNDGNSNNNDGNNNANSTEPTNTTSTSATTSIDTGNNASDRKAQTTDNVKPPDTAPKEGNDEESPQETLTKASELEEASSQRGEEPEAVSSNLEEQVRHIIQDLKVGEEASGQQEREPTISIPSAAAAKRRNSRRRSSNPVDLDELDDLGSDNADDEEQHVVTLPLALVLFYKIPFPELSNDDRASLTPKDLQQKVQVVWPKGSARIAEHEHQIENTETRYALLDADNKVLRVLFVSADGRVMQDLGRERETGLVPLAIARLNKLQFKTGPQPSWVRGALTSEDVPAEEYTAEELQREVEVIFPARWRIVPHSEQQENEPKRYAVYRPDGSLKRVIFVNHEGRIYEDRRGRGGPPPKKPRSSIRLGLGDFIFYSILVSKAAQYSFTAFCSCVVVILVGLASTLGILASLGKALPALPISIFLGVGYFLLTRWAIQPWIEDVFVEGLYL